MDNKDLPAFPLSLKLGEVFTGIDKIDGLTKREWFSGMAPVDIPSWFKHTPPEWKEVAMPQVNKIENEEHRREAKNWLHDPIYDLPEELSWFQKEYETYWESRRQYAVADQQARYFQWRRYYAEQLLTELSNSLPCS